MDPRSVSLSLVSHTNVGKTTLARTLLGRDVGEVRDAPHVTDAAEGWTLIETAQGERLRLWDTPGFGDSGRLLQRLQGRSNPLGWLLSEVWDRWRDRPFWASQQALRHVRDEADVVLYLVNAAESPEAAGYVAPEMALLGWVGRPVVVLLNQLGAPRDAAAEAAELERWRRHLGPRAAAVLPLDAFARCWVQEGVLWQTLVDTLPGPKRDTMARLAAAWQAGRRATFDAATAAIADGLARLALQRERLPTAGMRERLGSVIGLGAGGEAAAAAQQALAERLAGELQAVTAQLIRLHGLAGAAEREVVERVALQYEAHERLDEGKAALLGGALTGALAGLKADIATGGLTLGGGLLAGGLLGALGAAGVARGLNIVRGREHSWLTWSGAALDAALQTLLLRYLAVAHFGRGRGEWAAGEAPPHWAPVVAQALAPRRAALAALWQARAEQGDDASALAAALQPLVHASARAALEALYPGSWPADHNRRA